MRDTLLDEVPSLRDTKLLLVRLPVAVGPFGGLLFELFVSFAIAHLLDGSPLLGRN